LQAGQRSEKCAIFIPHKHTKEHLLPVIGELATDSFTLSLLQLGIQMLCRWHSWASDAIAVWLSLA